MSLTILNKNLQYLIGMVGGKEIEFRLSPKFEWEAFIFDKHTLDLFERSNHFRFKPQNDGG